MKLKKEYVEPFICLRFLAGDIVASSQPFVESDLSDDWEEFLGGGSE